MLLQVLVHGGELGEVQARADEQPRHLRHAALRLADPQFAAGLVEEVRRLRPRLSPEALQAVGYKEVVEHLDGRLTLEACIAAVEQGTRHLAKHQLTWYRRFSDIVWLPGDAPDLAAQALRLAREFLAG